MGLVQVANWRNPGWLTEKQLKCCENLFDNADPQFGTDKFREFLAGNYVLTWQESIVKS